MALCPRGQFSDRIRHTISMVSKQSTLINTITMFQERFQHDCIFNEHFERGLLFWRYYLNIPCGSQIQEAHTGTDVVTWCGFRAARPWGGPEIDDRQDNMRGLAVERKRHVLFCTLEGGGGVE